ncbi:WD40 repeat domain-containing protein, partial [Nodularia sphaerocarpa]|uniref:WD40 repeat domain-containing protein n=2 Tax=Nodularia sphaerocarpa TaxID=137816 RepID=UPI003A5AA063|nr:hypothetical protein [Nodularia sphaerocarpa CS-585A2]
DCTLRLWRIDGESLKPEKNITYPRDPVTCKGQQKPNGLLAISNNNAVIVSRFMPVQNDRVAVGLDKGEIQLRDVSTGEKIEELQDIEVPSAKGDRVFDLAFTQNSLFLFSGYGSGKVRLWSRTSANRQFQLKPQVIDLQTQLKLSGFQVRALTLSPDDQTLVIAGNFKRVLFGSWNPSQPDNQLRDLSLQTLARLDQRTGVTDFIWGVAFAPKSREKILATSDSAGYITIWNLNQCKTVKNDSLQNAITEVNCPQLDRWPASEKSSAVNTLKFSEDGRLLVSGGDDGRVMLWDLTTEYKLDQEKAGKGKTIYTSSKAIKSVDVKIKGQENMIVSGGEDFQVKLHRVK